MAQGGDLNLKDGLSGLSIYGETFDDENFKLKHVEGSVSMANFGKKNSNNSQFFICAINCPHLDDTNVVFGQVLRGFSIINEMEKYTTDEGKPTKVRKFNKPLFRVTHFKLFIGYYNRRLRRAQPR